MPDQPLDEAFARQLLQIGLITPEALEQARRAKAERDTPVPLAQVLVERGLLSAAQREKIERKLETARAEAGRLGPYRLLKKLGAGGMGAVYLAELPSSRLRFAVKVLPKSAAKEPDALRRFLREIDAARSLDHPNIVRSAGYGEDRGFHYYVMEHVEGETLGARLRRDGAFPPDEATRVVGEIARGLAYAHAQGLVHRDIKPDNVMIGPGGAVKILDMGLSKSVGGAHSFLTSTGILVGTPHYIAPEQARAEKDVDGRADLYALGATYYHLVSGEPPFHGPSAVEVIAQHLNRQLPDPRDVRDGIPDGVVHVIRKLMAKERDDRYPDAAALLADLDLVLQGRGPGSQALDPARSSIAQPLSKEARERFRRSLRRSPPRPAGLMPLWIGGAAALLLAALAVVAFRPAPPRAAPGPFTLDLGDGVAMDFVDVKPGVYDRGGGHETREAWELTPGPSHKVEISRGFRLGKHEVTRRQFAAFVKASGYVTEAEKAGSAWGRDGDGSWRSIPGNSWRSPANLAQDDEHPVVCVTWFDATAFCDWLSARHGIQARLPTEAEWEYACRAGAAAEADLGETAWFDANAGWSTRPVGRKKPNAWGFHDMLGNAWEWCLDWGAPYAAGDARDPRGPERGDRKIMRGGAWYLAPPLCRPSTRAQFGPQLRYTSVGFRVALP